jgi:spermidine synthase
MVATFCSGLASLGYEVAWFRVLTLLSDHRAHTFSAIVAIVLLGIGAGSLAMVRLKRRGIDPAMTLAAVLFALGAAGLLWLPVVTGLSSVLGGVLAAFSPTPSRSGVPLAVALLVTFVPCVLMGMSFPLAVQVYTRRSRDLGQSVGRMYAVNLIGATAGSVLAGFLLLPMLGAHRTLAVLALACCGAAALMLHRGGRRGQAFLASGILVAATSLVLVVPGNLLDALFAELYPRARVLASHEDVEATVTLARHDDVTVMYINGAHQADNSPATLQVHRLIGSIPCLVHPGVQDALVVGMGGGTTSGAIARCVSRSLTIVEISPGVVEAARTFHVENANIADSHNAEIVVADGRNYLLLTDRRFDLVTADTIRPIHAHSGNLYSRDYYLLMASRLKENGIVLQWIDLSLRDHEERILMRTFASAFPHVAMCEPAGSRFLLASLQPLTIDAGSIARRMTTGVGGDLGDAGVPSADAFVRSCALAGDDLRAAIGEGPIVSDDRPINEYFNLLRIGGLWTRLPVASAAYRPASR